MNQPRHFKKALVISKTKTQTLQRSRKAIVSDLRVMWCTFYPVHFNCFHHRSHSTVLYKEWGSIKPLREATCRLPWGYRVPLEGTWRKGFGIKL